MNERRAKTLGGNFQGAEVACPVCGATVPLLRSGMIADHYPAPPVADLISAFERTPGGLCLGGYAPPARMEKS